MDTVKRKVTYRLYPSDKQNNRMNETLRLHQKLYNACLEQRIDAYRRCGLSLSFAAQCRELTALRAECPEYASLNAQSEQVTIKRLDLAFQGYWLPPGKSSHPNGVQAGCDFVEKKHLAERQHQCKQCDLRLDRDVNAAIVMLKYAKKSRGQELALSAEKVKTPLPLKHETPPIIASAI